MIVLAKIQPNKYSAIMDLVRSGNYESIQNFVEVALQNQILIEQSNSQVPAKNSFTTSFEQQLTSQPTTSPEPLVLLPSYDKVKTAIPTPITYDSNSRLTWGLTTRLAPAKLVLRLLANALATTSNDLVELKKFTDDIVTLATQLRSRFVSIEKKLDLIRGESFQAGFPQKDVKSQQRFADMYIGKPRSANRVSGILADLQFVRISRVSNNNSSIGITEHGLKLASMRSPMIDELLLEGKKVQGPLSEEEIGFILKHVRRVRKEEYDFLDYIFRTIKEGADTPTKLADHVKNFFRKDGYSEKVATTLRVGGVAKLVEMRLVRIEKDGLYSTYRVSNGISNLEALLK